MKKIIIETFALATSRLANTHQGIELSQIIDNFEQVMTLLHALRQPGSSWQRRTPSTSEIQLLELRRERLQGMIRACDRME